MSKRIEKIMQDYPQMVMERTCLENQIKNLKGITADEIIDSMIYSHPEGERVQTSGVSNKTANIAISYKDKMAQINLEWRGHLEKKHSILLEELVFFESAVLSLSDNLPEFISDMVMEGMTWDDLAEKYHVSRTMVAKYRKKAIRELEILYSVHDREVTEYILS